MRTAPALAVAGGSVVKASWVAVSGFTATAVLAAVVKDREVSVAVRVQARALSTASALNVATPTTAVAVTVPPRVHEDVMVTASVAPAPVVITLPNESSTETLKVASDDPALAVVGGCVVKASLVAEPRLTVTDVLVAVVRFLDVSLPVRVQAPVSSIMSALNVATPATAVAVTVPPRVHADEIVMVSTAPVPVVSTLPNVSSTVTLNVARAAPSLAVVGGWVVNATLFAVLGLTVTAVLAAVASVVEVSVAVRVQEVPVSIASALNVAMPPLAVATAVPPRTHEEETVTESVKSVVAGALVPSSIKTLNVARVAPATVVVGGWVVKASLVACAADAGEAETKIKPVVKTVEHATRVSTADSLERTDLRPPPRFITFFMDDSLV